MESIAVKKIDKVRGKVSRSPCVRFTYKSLYINNEAGKLLNAEYITISILKDKGLHVLRLAPAKRDDDNSFKLSQVCESQYARRIETNRSLESILDAGFPRNLLGENLPVIRLFDGSLLVNIFAEE